MAVNLGGAVNVVKTFVPLIRSHGNGGHVVNTSSMAGITVAVRRRRTRRRSSRFAASASRCDSASLRRESVSRCCARAHPDPHSRRS
jgi:NAD(P)-dependent dehydrogenase (short-subunit alcohol dehydrogenase family)